MSRLLALVVSALLPSAALAAKEVSPTERTQAFVALLLKVRSEEDGKPLTAAEKQTNEKLFTELDGYFDWSHLTQAPIEPRKDKFSAAQKDEYAQKFREVLRLIAYPDSGVFFRKSEYTLGAPEEGKTDAGVPSVAVPINARVVKDDLQTKVDIHWAKSPEGLRIVDVSFDGDSLVTDYQNQFTRIVDKEGAKGLIGRIDKRRAELAAPPKPKKK